MLFFAFSAPMGCFLGFFLLDVFDRLVYFGNDVVNVGFSNLMKMNLLSSPLLNHEFAH